MHCVHNVLFFNCDFVTCSQKPRVIAFTFLCIHNTCTLVYLKDFNFKSATRLLKRQHSRVKNFTYWQVTFSFRSLILFSYYQHLQCLAPGARVHIIPSFLRLSPFMNCCLQTSGGNVPSEESRTRVKTPKWSLKCKHDIFWQVHIRAMVLRWPAKACWPIVYM